MRQTAGGSGARAVRQGARVRKAFVAAALCAAVLAGVHARAIVGGAPADDGEYPWVAAIYTGGDPAEGQFCGGTLVAPTVVVTARHCVNDLLDNLTALLPDVLGRRLRVVVGQTRLSSTAGERLTPRHVTLHPDTAVDIAVIELTSRSSRTPLRIAHATDAALIEPGTLATITGWGATSEGGAGSNDLLEAQVPIVSDGQCYAHYGGRTVPATELCAGYSEGGVDACQGDSGGPLMVPDPEGGFLLAGVTSWGDGCGRAHRPGVYAEVAAAAAFIDQFLR